MEDYAYVLDVLPDGRPDSKRRFRREPVVYGLGIEEFKIFDMEPVTGAAINIGDRCPKKQYDICWLSGFWNHGSEVTARS